MTMVTSHNSGSSYFSRVELQNACHALTHDNFFIPSMLLGSCRSESGHTNVTLEVPMCSVWNNVSNDSSNCSSNEFM